MRGSPRLISITRTCCRVNFYSKLKTINEERVELTCSSTQLTGSTLLGCQNNPCAQPQQKCHRGVVLVPSLRRDQDYSSTGQQQEKGAQGRAYRDRNCKQLVCVQH